MSELIRAAGGVVYTHNAAGELLILVIEDRYGSRTLPKGHLERGESDEAAAVREIAEETGIACTIEQLIARVRYPVYKKGNWRDKEVAYFLARAPFTPPTAAVDEGITIAEWAAAETLTERLTYAQVREVVRQALAILRKA